MKFKLSITLIALFVSNSCFAMTNASLSKSDEIAIIQSYLNSEYDANEQTAKALELMRDRIAKSPQPATLDFLKFYKGLKANMDDVALLDKTRSTDDLVATFEILRDDPIFEKKSTQKTLSPVIAKYNNKKMENFTEYFLETQKLLNE